MNEVLVRVIRGHWRLLLVFLVLPAIVVAAAGALVPAAYAAGARFQASSTSPGSDVEADAVLNRVKGIATSPAVLEQALHDGGITTRGVTATVQEVTIARLGTSAVFDLTVTDADPAVATTLAATLATDTVNFLNGVGGPSSKLVNDLSDHQNQLLAQRQEVASRLALSTDPVLTADLSAQVAGIDQRVSQISSSLGQLQNNGASGASAVMISQAGPAAPAPTKIVTDLGLAVVLGLVVGLMVAAVVEVVRPRVADGRAFSREIDAPLLGRLNDRASARDVEDRITDPEMVVGLRAAAERAGVGSVVLVGPGQPQRLVELAYELDTVGLDLPAPATEGQAPTGPTQPGVPRVSTAEANGSGHLDAGTVKMLARPWPVADRPAPRRLLVTAIDELDETTRAATTHALVPVIPDLAAYSEVRRIRDLVDATGWPVLGVIADPARGAAPRLPGRPAWTRPSATRPSETAAPETGAPETAAPEAAASRRGLLRRRRS